MYFNCPCGQRYKMVAKNTNVYTYPTDPKYNWFETECPKCKAIQQYFFLGDPNNVMPHLAAAGVMPEQSDEVPARIEELYEEVIERDGDPEDDNAEIQTHELSPRHEAEIAKLARELESTPDEWIQEIFTHPPPKSDLPMRWT